MIIEQYSQDGETCLWMSKRKGKKKIIETIRGFKPYFYVPEQDKHKAIQYPNVKKVVPGYKNLWEKPVVKIVTKESRDVGNLREKFTDWYEADILFPNRYLVDEQPDFGDKPLFLYFDIEAPTPDGKFPTTSEAKYPVTSISFISSYNPDLYGTLYFVPGGMPKRTKKVFKDRVTGKEKEWLVIECENEESLFSEFIRVVEQVDPDYFTGWYTDKFDVPYLLKRAENLGIDIGGVSPFGRCYQPRPFRGEERTPVIKGRGIFDLLKPYKKLHITQLSSFKLDVVAEEELGVKKLPYAGDLYDLYTNDIERFLEYNIADVELCLHLDDKVGVTDYFWEMTKFIGCQLGNTMSASQMNDVITLKYARKLGVVLPSKKPTMREGFRGAIVLEPKKGRHENVLVLDLSKIYPRIIIDANMSPETVMREGQAKRVGLDKCIRLGNGLWVRKDKKGFAPNVLEELFDIENMKKADMKLAAAEHGYDSKEYHRAKLNRQFVKDNRNSFYGLMSYKGFRLFAPDIGSSITYMGRQALKFCRDQIEDLGYEVIYGDTDSIFVQAKETDKESIVREGLVMEEHINKAFDKFAERFHIDTHNFNIEFEKAYDTLVMLSKKRYDGFTVWIDGTFDRYRDSKGIETQRSDTAKITKDFLVGLLDRIHEGSDKEEVDEFFLGFVQKVFDAKLDRIGIPKAINKEIDEYKVKSAHIRGAEYSNQNLKTSYGVGSKPFMVYVKKTPRNMPDYDVVCFDDEEQLTDGFVVDHEKMVETLLSTKAQRVYEAVGWLLPQIDCKVVDGRVMLTKQETLGVFS